MYAKNLRDIPFQCPGLVLEADPGGSQKLCRSAVASLLQLLLLGHLVSGQAVRPISGVGLCLAFPEPLEAVVAMELAGLSRSIPLVALFPSYELE